MNALLEQVLQDDLVRRFYQHRWKELQQPIEVSTKPEKVNRKCNSTSTTPNQLKKTKFDRSSSGKVECACCFEKVPSRNTLICPSRQHIFCHACVCKYVDIELFENQNTEIRCMSTAECQSIFEPDMLKPLLSTKSRKKFEERIYVSAAEKLGLVQCECPKCHHLGLSPKKISTFTCKNENCSYKSCRFCHEEAHTPIKCSQVEKKATRSARNIVEEAMSSALIHYCPDCNTPFVKDSGCNIMSCPKRTCDGRICYVCRKDLRKSTCNHSHTAYQEKEAVRVAGTKKMKNALSKGVKGLPKDLVDRLVS